jgi:hypothetical protein
MTLTVELHLRILLFAVLLCWADNLVRFGLSGFLLLIPNMNYRPGSAHCSAGLFLARYYYILQSDIARKFLGKTSDFYVSDR